MGNEDVVVCKNVCDNSQIEDSAVIEATRGVQKLNIKDNSEANDEKEKRLDFVQILPMELIEEIFLFLSPQDLASCTSVSSSWREAVNSNKVWGCLCEKKGWKDDYDSNFSHFVKAHRQFRRWTHTYHSFSPICQKRLLYNKHSCLHSNWRNGRYIPHKITGGNSNILQLFEPVTCDGRYLIMLEKNAKHSQNTNLCVWSLNEVPYKLCTLPLPHKVHPVDAVAFDKGTVAVAQAWVIVVYQLNRKGFVKAYEKNDLRDLEPSKLPKDMKQMIPYLRVTDEHVICVPSQSHSTVDFIPIFFWDRLSGELKSSLSFDSMYYAITSATWFGDSCYLSLSNKKKKSYQIVEFGLKTCAWEAFSQSVTVEVEQIAVSNQYVLAVTKSTNRSMYGFYNRNNENNHKELWLWDRATGSALKTFETQGKSFQFVDDYLLYFESTKVTVMNPKDENMCSEFEVAGTISSIRAACHPSIMVIIKTGCYIEVWDWGLGSRLYTITAETGYGSQLWCDDKRIITYNSADHSTGGGIMVLGFW